MQSTSISFEDQISEGIPSVLPPAKPYDETINHAPKRKDILSKEGKKLAFHNALGHFDPSQHAELLPEFKYQLETYGRIYMYRLRPDYKMYARALGDYPAQSKQAMAIMLMIQNNLEYTVAQHPHELTTYGENGAVFSNWSARYSSWHDHYGVVSGRDYHDVSGTGFPTGKLQIFITALDLQPIWPYRML